MKIAICISGIARGNVDHHVDLLKKAFPDGDLFYATWEEQQNDISKRYKEDLFPEPELHYNPWYQCVTDNPHPKYEDYKRNWLKGRFPKDDKLIHANKQIIAHAHQIQNLPEMSWDNQKYDMIVRCRWDTVVSTKVNWKYYLDKSYNESQAIGFGIRGNRHIDLHSFKDIDHVYITRDTDQVWSRDWSYWINDPLIIHPKKLLDPNYVFKLYEDKNLWPAEYGWYQVLSKGDNHHCVYGGASIDRYVGLGT